MFVRLFTYKLDYQPLASSHFSLDHNLKVELFKAVFFVGTY